jgi:hypothetical protein
LPQFLSFLFFSFPNAFTLLVRYVCTHVCMYSRMDRIISIYCFSSVLRRYKIQRSSK